MHHHLRPGRWSVTLTQRLFHRRDAQGPLLAQQADQHRLHTTLALLGRQVQQPQVLLGGPLGLVLLQHIVRLPEVAAGKQVGLVAVIGEGSRLAEQPVDDVSILDLVLAPATQPRELLHLPLGIPDLDPLGIQAGLHPLPDQTTGHRVDIARHMNEAARLDPHLQPFARFQPPGRQGMQ